MNNQDDDFIEWNNTFKLVFSNIVLLRKIYYYVRKYRDNEHMVFEDLNSLKTYKDRNYNSSIEYRGEYELSKGDLPEHGLLKFTEPIYHSVGEIIPFGVEIVEYSENYSNYQAPFSTLPTTIHKKKNAHVVPIFLKGFKTYFIEIPPNITSISFSNCPNITQNEYQQSGGYTLKLPKTHKELSFDNNWGNERITLTKGDIPDGN